MTLKHLLILLISSISLSGAYCAKQMNVSAIPSSIEVSNTNYNEVEPILIQDNLFLISNKESWTSANEKVQKEVCRFSVSSNTVLRFIIKRIATDCCSNEIHIQNNKPVDPRLIGFFYKGIIAD